MYLLGMLIIMQIRRVPNIIIYYSTNNNSERILYVLSYLKSSLNKSSLKEVRKKNDPKTCNLAVLSGITRQIWIQKYKQ